MVETATTTQKDAMLDYIASMMDAVYIARDPEIAKSERRKMLREIDDDLHNLKHYIINEVN